MEHLDLARYELSVSFVTPQSIQELNSSYRQKDSVTDVLSFPQQTWETPKCFQPTAAPLKSRYSGPPLVLGDLVICLEKAQENAQSIGHSLDRETAFLLIHGILHLAGHDHEDPEEEALMTCEQTKFLEAMLKAASIDQPLWHQCVSLTEVKTI